MRINYVMIDYENVQPDSFQRLDPEVYHIRIFVGANQSKIPVEVACALQTRGDKARYIKVSGSGKNALDFYIAFYIGKIAAETPEAYFHIISKDTGFDPLIEHLKQQKILVKRSADISQIVGKPPVDQSFSERTEKLLERMKTMGNSKPRKLKTLRSTIEGLFQKKLAAPEIDALLAGLKTRGVVRDDQKGNVFYTL